MKRTFGLLCVLLFAAYMMMTWAAVARADVVLEWNVIAVNTAIASGQNPFAQATRSDDGLWANWKLTAEIRRLH